MNDSAKQSEAHGSLEEKSGSRLHWYILAGLVLGAVCGSLVNAGLQKFPQYQPRVAWALRNIFDPAGQVFLRLLFLTVIPLVFASLAIGVAKLGDIGNLGRVGAKTFAYFIGTTALAVVIGLVLVNTLRPGANLPAETKAGLQEKFQADAAKKLEKPAEFGVDTFVNVVPRNPLKAATDMDMLAVIFVALLVGVGLTRIPGEQSKLLITALEGVGELMVFIINLAMKIAPVGVFALIFSTTATFGFGLLRQLGFFVAVVLAGLAIQMFIVYPVLVAFLGRMNPIDFFRKVWNVIVTAFSTSSSNATLPTSLRTAQEELRIPAPLAGFVLPLGATMNMNGTALFEGVTVVFLAQVFGVELSLAQQAIVVVLCVLTAVGAAGVPGGSIPLLALVLASVGVPPAGIAIILGVDRILDMCRTTLNVVGDLTAAVFVARTESSGKEHPLGVQITATDKK